MNRAHARQARPRSRVALSGWFVWTAGLLACVHAAPAWADANADLARAEAERVSVARDSSGVEAAMKRARAYRPSLEARLASADALFRSRDYERAVVVLGELIEEAPGSMVEGDSRFLRAEAYHARRELLAARRDYRVIVESASAPRYARHAAKALARLVDIAVKRGELDLLDELFTRIDALPQGNTESVLRYARGKGLYARRDYAAAEAMLAQVGDPYTHQAGYHLGLIAMRTAPSVAVGAVQSTTAAGAPAARVKTDYRSALERFAKVTAAPAGNDEQRHVVDLAWMAIGRLHYENEDFVKAAAAYQHVQRSSPEHATMLYELAWVHVRLGDVERAERALELLAVADPNAEDLGAGSLLRADLLLRTGAFRKAESLYESVKTVYEPARDTMGDFLASEQDPGVYYDRMTQADGEASALGALPTMAVRWAREADDGERAMALVDDVVECRELIHKSRELSGRLQAILEGGNRVRAFPELLAGEQQLVGLLNRLGGARAAVAAGLDREEPSQVQGELHTTREERRRQLAALAQAPTSAGDFDARDYDGQKQWNGVSQRVSQHQREVDTMQATVNGLRRFLREKDSTVSAERRAELGAQIDAAELELQQRQNDIVALRREVEFGRSQVGLGDSRYQAEGEARAKLREAMNGEVSLLRGGAAGAGARAYAERASVVLGKIDAEEDRLIGLFRTIDAEVAVRAADIASKVREEHAKIDGYELQLRALEDEARVAVGEVLQRNFGLVLDKLEGLVLRADVGLTEHAWEVREEEMYRLHILQTARARQEQALDQELQEVLGEDDGPGKDADAP